MVPQGQLPENSRCQGLIVPGCMEPAHLFGVLFAAFKEVDQIEPDLLHPLGRVARLAVKVLIGLIQLPGEVFQLLPGGGRAAPELA